MLGSFSKPIGWSVTVERQEIISTGLWLVNIVIPIKVYALIKSHPAIFNNQHTTLGTVKEYDPFLKLQNKEIQSTPGDSFEWVKLHLHYALYWPVWSMQIYMSMFVTFEPCKKQGPMPGALIFEGDLNMTTTLQIVVLIIELNNLCTEMWFGTRWSKLLDLLLRFLENKTFPTRSDNNSYNLVNWTYCFEWRHFTFHPGRIIRPTNNIHKYISSRIS